MASIRSAIDLLAEASPRFWEKVDKTDGCWVWTAARAGGGYGVFWFQRRNVPAHRFSLMEAGVDIPEDMQVDHLCRNRQCVRPDHLEVVDCRTNLLRGDTIPAHNAAKTHCPEGHPYSGANLYTHSRGRQCRACNRESSLRWWRRNHGIAA